LVRSGIFRCGRPRLFVAGNGVRRFWLAPDSAQPSKIAEKPTF
jgi:hypothetical protein